MESLIWKLQFSLWKADLESSFRKIFNLFYSKKTYFEKFILKDIIYVFSESSFHNIFYILEMLFRKYCSRNSIVEILFWKPYFRNFRILVMDLKQTI